MAAGKRTNGRPGSAGSRPVVVTPAHLSTYARCARQYDLQFRRRRRGAFTPATSAMTEGIVLHGVLRDWFRSHRDGWAATDPEAIARSIRAGVWRGLDADGYGTPTEHLVALRAVADDAAWCLEQIPADVTVRWTERTLPSDAVAVAGIPVRFEARVDLVVEHGDGEIEHVDFKTGGPREDHWIQRAVERLVVGTAHPATPDRPATRTTTLYARTRQADSGQHTPESFAGVRAELRDLTVRMLTDETAEPSPSALCEWCRFREICRPGERGSD